MSNYSLVLARREDRDSYGVLTIPYLRSIAYEVRTWQEGWNDCAFIARVSHKTSLPSASYADIRHYISGLVDLPILLIFQIALWCVRNECTGSRTPERHNCNDNVFNPVL